MLYSTFWEPSHNLNSDFGKKKTKEKNKQTKKQLLQKDQTKNMFEPALFFLLVQWTCA